MSNLKLKQEKGKIRPGQRWMKVDSGATLVVISKQPNSTWRVAFDTRTIKSSHKMKEHVIYKYYVRV